MEYIQQFNAANLSNTYIICTLLPHIDGHLYSGYAHVYIFIPIHIT